MDEGRVYTVPVSILIGKNVTVKISFRKKTQRNKYIRGNMRTKSLGKRSNYPGDMMQYQIAKSTIQLSVDTDPGSMERECNSTLLLFHSKSLRSRRLLESRDKNETTYFIIEYPASIFLEEYEKS